MMYNYASLITDWLLLYFVKHSSDMIKSGGGSRHFHFPTQEKSCPIIKLAFFCIYPTYTVQYVICERCGGGNFWMP